VLDGNCLFCDHWIILKGVRALGFTTAKAANGPPMIRGATVSVAIRACCTFFDSVAHRNIELAQGMKMLSF
jgi:hypothetical protein